MLMRVSLRCWYKSKSQHIATGLVAAVVVLCGPIATPVANASTAAPSSENTATSPPIVMNQQKTAGVPMTSHPVNGWPSIVSQAAVVMDMSTGTVIYAKHPLTPHYPASITKILTAMLALQDGHLTDLLTTSQLAAKQPPDKLYLVPGEVEPLKKLLYGMMMISANDVAVEIAQHYGGSVAGFAKMMNQEARALGADHSHFDNPGGLPDPHHITTAYDMAVISRAAMQIPEFRKIVDTRSYDWHGLKWSAHLVNINHMLFNYPGAIGVKTGYTSEAHETLVVAARRGGNTFLAVLMDARLDSQIQADATQLLNFAFAHYQTDTVLPQGTVVGTLKNPSGGHPIQVVTKSPVLATMPIGDNVSAARHLHVTLPDVGAARDTLVGNLTLTDSADSGAVDVPVQIAQAYGVAPTVQNRPPIWRNVLIVVGCVVLAGWILRARRRRKLRMRRRTRYASSSVSRRNVR